MQEIWKDIPDYEGLYQASNLGRIKSLNRIDNCNRLRKSKILKFTKINNGYLQVQLSKNGKTQVLLVHRLIALTFLDNSNEFKIVNHINGIKTDNRVENLEWCTQSHNINESYRLGLQIRQYGKDNYHSKNINQYDLQGNFIKTWDSFMDIERELNFNHSNLQKVCCGKYKFAYGYIWRYANE